MEFNPKTSENCISLIQFKPDCPAVGTLITQRHRVIRWQLPGKRQIKHVLVLSGSVLIFFIFPE